MTKTQLLNKVQNKIGFHSIIKDALAPDHEQGDAVEKRYLYINVTNADGTMGKTYVFYLLDTATQTAWFYNVEPEALDTKEVGTEQKKLNALANYLKSKYEAYFIGRFDLSNNWAEADVFTLTTDTLTKKSILVYKKGSNPITDIDVI